MNKVHAEWMEKLRAAGYIRVDGLTVETSGVRNAEYVIFAEDPNWKGKWARNNGIVAVWGDGEKLPDGSCFIAMAFAAEEFVLAEQASTKGQGANVPCSNGEAPVNFMEMLTLQAGWRRVEGALVPVDLVEEPV